MSYEVDPLEAERKSPILMRDVTCIRCGYNLKGVDRTGTCPECGTFIERSLRGTMLPHADPDYLAALHRGSVVIVSSIIASIVVNLAMFAAAIGFAIVGATAGPPPGAPPGVMPGPGAMPEWVDTLNLLLGTGIALVGVFGWWLLTSPDPGGTARENSPRARIVVRALSIASAVVTLIAFVSTLIVGSASIGAAIASGAVTPGLVLGIIAGFLSGIALPIARFFAELVYIRALARRIPDTLIAEKAKKLRWQCPLVFVLGAVCFWIGPIIAFILYYRLLNSVRRALKEIRPDVRFIDSRPMSG